MTASRSDAQKSSNLPQKLAVGLLLAIVLGWIFRGFLWQVVESMMLNVLPVLLTPVILELSVGFAGLFIVLMFCHLRKKRVDEEWVEFSEEELEAARAIETPKMEEVKRERAAKIDQSLIESVAALVAGGNFREAQDRMSSADEETKTSPAFVRQRLMVTLGMEDWGAAREYSARWPAAGEMLALVCVDAARFFIKQKPPRKEAATECLEIGKGLSVGAVMNGIDSDGALQKLA